MCKILLRQMVEQFNKNGLDEPTFEEEAESASLTGGFQQKVIIHSPTREQIEGWKIVEESIKQEEVYGRTSLCYTEDSLRLNSSTRAGPGNASHRITDVHLNPGEDDNWELNLSVEVLDNDSGKELKEAHKSDDKNLKMQLFCDPGTPKAISNFGKTEILHASFMVQES